jgi:hypothetical protein
VASVVEGLRPWTSNYLPLTCVVDSRQGLWIRPYSEAIQLGYGLAMPVCAWNSAQKGTWDLLSPVKESCHMTFTVLVRHTLPLFLWTLLIKYKICTFLMKFQNLYSLYVYVLNLTKRAIKFKRKLREIKTEGEDVQQLL